MEELYGVALGISSDQAPWVRRRAQQEGPAATAADEAGSAGEDHEEEEEEEEDDGDGDGGGEEVGHSRPGRHGRRTDHCVGFIKPVLGATRTNQTTGEQVQVSSVSRAGPRVQSVESELEVLVQTLEFQKFQV